MIRINVEVVSGARIFNTVIRAENIVPAVTLAQARYPGSNVRVLFPIDPEGFFCEHPTPATVLTRLEMPEEKAE